VRWSLSSQCPVQQCPLWWHLEGTTEIEQYIDVPWSPVSQKPLCCLEGVPTGVQRSTLLNLVKEWRFPGSKAPVTGALRKCCLRWSLRPRSWPEDMGQAGMCFNGANLQNSSRVGVGRNSLVRSSCSCGFSGDQWYCLLYEC
jgi:hypothetical protein